MTNAVLFALRGVLVLQLHPAMGRLVKPGRTPERRSSI